MAGIGSERYLGGRAERRARRADSSALEGFDVARADVDLEVLEGIGSKVGNTIPGESRSFSLLSIFTSRIAVVTPASAPTGQAVLWLRLRRDVSAFIMEDLPTLGYPITPTVIERLSCLPLAKVLRALKSVSDVPFTVRALWSKVRALGAGPLARRGRVGK